MVAKEYQQKWQSEYISRTDKNMSAFSLRMGTLYALD